MGQNCEDEKEQGRFLYMSSLFWVEIVQHRLCIN